MKLLHIDSSPKGERSNSRLLTRFFVDQLRTSASDLIVDALDLSTNPPPHPTAMFASAIYTPADQRTPEMNAATRTSDALCRQLLDADAAVFGMPMHNWCMPSVFKAYIDNIIRMGITFLPQPDGRYKGMLAGKPLLFVTTRGGDLRPGSPYEKMDTLTPAVRTAFEFIGADQITFVDAQPLQFADPTARAAALDRAKADLTRVADRWAKTTTGKSL
jgi:FMN-dependent NADH-azoreductase